MGKGMKMAAMGGAGGGAGGGAAVGPSSAFSAPTSASSALMGGGDAGAGANAFQANNSFQAPPAFSMQSPNVAQTSPFQQMSNGGDFNMQAFQPTTSDFQSMGQGKSFQLDPNGPAKKPGFDWKKFGQDVVANTPPFKMPEFKSTPYQPIQAAAFTPLTQAPTAAGAVAAPTIKSNVQGPVNRLYPEVFNNLG